MFSVATENEFWKKAGLCADGQIPQETFFTIFEKANKEAKVEILKICHPCPVRKECHEYGRKTNSTGIWGGVYLESGRPVKRFMDLESKDAKHQARTRTLVKKSA